jgi:hypothetical protein
MSGAELQKLERRVDIAMKGMNLLLFGEAEQISSKERAQEEIEGFFHKKDSEFGELKDFQGPNA